MSSGVVWRHRGETEQRKCTSESETTTVWTNGDGLLDVSVFVPPSYFSPSSKLARLHIFFVCLFFNPHSRFNVLIPGTQVWIEKNDVEWIRFLYWCTVTSVHCSRLASAPLRNTAASFLSQGGVEKSQPILTLFLNCGLKDKRELLRHLTVGSPISCLYVSPAAPPPCSLSASSPAFFLVFPDFLWFVGTYNLLIEI